MDQKLSSCCQVTSGGEQMRQAGRVPATCPPGFAARYTVRPGDTMFFIAQRFGVSLNALIAANPHIPNPALIFPGDVLCVPGAIPPPANGRVPTTCPPGFTGRYTVQSGDTMFFIAQRIGVSLNALIAANPHIPNPALIFPGDVLCVPGPPPVCRVPVTCPPGFMARYTVQPGDTMFLIAQRFGVSLNSLIAANPHISDPAVIFPCDVLCVPGPPPVCRVPVTCPPGFMARYTVQPGDTMFLIAQRFGVSLNALIAANPHIPDPAVLFPCDVLCVPGNSCSKPPHKPPHKPPKKALALQPAEPDSESDYVGYMLVHNLDAESQIVSVTASNLPEPQELGDYNRFEAIVVIPGEDTYRFDLGRTQESPAIYAGTTKLDTDVLSGDTRVRVRPYSSKTGDWGLVVLSAALQD